MSYDISLHATLDTGSEQPIEIGVADIGNYTANVSGMWEEALGYPLADLHDKTAGDHTEDLKRAVADMAAHPLRYEEMEPANGWGSYEGAYAYLRSLRDACLLHPKATIRVSH